jgi:succinate-semialdehyde dehydrogenase/glutarate-semialdehyde dehydrogenase
MSDLDLGPLISERQQSIVNGFLAKGHDLTTVAQGEIVSDAPSGGCYVAPTLFADVGPNHTLAQDEIFGPVAAIQTFTDQDDVIRRANDTEYGLVAYVFSEDMKRALQVCERLEYGMVGLNRGLVSDPAAPFGGVKQSGLGREGGHEGMLEFMETQYISVSW